MVLGENLQATVGLNHQLTLGSNLQLFYNPLGLLSGIHFPGLAPLGSAVGGNTQFTIGTNVQATYGQNIEINCGYDKLELNNKADPVSTILCGVMGSAILVFSLAYHAQESDHDRTKSALGFQVLVEALIIALVEVAGTKTQKEKAKCCGEDANARRKEMFVYNIDLTDFGNWMAKVLRSPEFEAVLTLLVAGTVLLELLDKKAAIEISAPKPTPTGPYE
jgi:hypothetical protein